MADAFDDVYFASCTPRGGIYRYRMYEDGSLCFADKISCDRPMYMIADGDVLYVLLRQPFTDIDESGLMTYDIHSDGSLTERLPVVTTGGNVACHLCVFKKNIYAAHYVSGSIFSTGGRTVRLSGSSVHPERQNSPHPHMIIPSPDGKYLMCADLGADAILLYDENLNMIDKTRAPAGSGAIYVSSMYITSRASMSFPVRSVFTNIGTLIYGICIRNDFTKNLMRKIFSVRRFDLIKTPSTFLLEVRTSFQFFAGTPVN